MTTAQTAEHRVLVIERNLRHAFAPSFLWVMTGDRRPDQVTRDLRELMHPDFRPSHELMALRGDTRELLFEGKPPVVYDLLVAIPPHRAPTLLREAGLAGETGWIPVDRQTLATSHDRVFAIGDVTTVSIPAH